MLGIAVMTDKGIAIMKSSKTLTEYVVIDVIISVFHGMLRIIFFETIHIRED